MKDYKGTKIYESLGEIIASVHTCLVVWDVQNGLVDRCFNREFFMANLKKLIEGARGKLPIVYTLITPLPKTFQSSWGLYSMMRRYKVDDPEKIPMFMATGSKEREIPEGVKSAPEDILLEKATPNIFIGTNFEPMMRNRGITTLIFTGIATEMGVETSARDAGARGFYPVIAADCVSSADKESHERSLAYMSKAFVTADSADILRNLG